jgi:hypothetical protein
MEETLFDKQKTSDHCEWCYEYKIDQIVGSVHGERVVVFGNIGYNKLVNRALRIFV